MSTSSRAYIYVIGDGVGNVVKIGYTDTPLKRLGQIQTSNPTPLHLLCILPGTRHIEQQLHRRFARRCVHGEWFDFKQENAVSLVAQAWLDIVEPEALELPPLPMSRLSRAEELLRAVAEAFDDSYFLGTVELIKCLLVHEDGWWVGQWGDIGPRSAQMSLAQYLRTFHVRHVRHQIAGVQQQGYMRQDVLAALDASQG